MRVLVSLERFLAEPSYERGVSRPWEAFSLALFASLSLFTFHLSFIFLVALSAFSYARKPNISVKTEQVYILSFFVFFIISLSTALNNKGIISILFTFSLFALFNIFYFVFKDSPRKIFLLSGLIFCSSFMVLEFYIIWVWIFNVQPNPSDLVELVNSPILVVPNDLAYMIFLLPLMQLLDFNIERYRKLKLLYIYFNYLLFVLVSIILQSRLSIALSGLAIFMMFFRFSEKTVVTLLMSIFLFSLFVIGATFILGKPIEVLETRLTLWYAAIEGISQRPFLGHGFDSFGQYYDNFRSTASMSDNYFLAIDQRYIPWPHNLVLDLMFSFGALIVIPLLFFIKKSLEYIRDHDLVSRPVFFSILLFSIIAFIEVTYLRPATTIILAFLFGLAANPDIQGLSWTDKKKTFSRPTKND